MVGRVVEIKKNVGDVVEAGDVLIAVNAMKMVSNAKKKNSMGND
jgi:biotin carboxyl carrier protein